ncbi:MAG: phytanoyl-CoA dioxygenase family protein [Planctomycetota bacterium]
MPNVLNADQIRAYQKNGVLFPLPALGPAELAHFRSCHDEFSRRLGGKPSGRQIGECHLHFKWACDLATHPRVLDAVENIIGPDIIIHSSTVFTKQAKDDRFVSWHQDSHYWKLLEPRLVSAWIALTDSSIENGCLRVLPGTHTRRFEHTTERHENNMLGTGLTVSEELDLTQAVDVVLRAGEMSFHHADIIHGSNPNTSTGSRIGFAIRYVSSSVEQQRGHHEVILARGEDKFHHFTAQSKPTAGLEEGLVAQEAFESGPSRNY